MDLFDIIAAIEIFHDIDSIPGSGNRKDQCIRVQWRDRYANIVGSDTGSKHNPVGAAGIGDDVPAVTDVEAILVIVVAAAKVVITATAGDNIISIAGIDGLTRIEADDHIVIYRLI